MCECVCVCVHVCVCVCVRVCVGSSRPDDANCDSDHYSLLPPLFLQERLEQGTAHTHRHTYSVVLVIFVFVSFKQHP